MNKKWLQRQLVYLSVDKQQMKECILYTEMVHLLERSVLNQNEILEGILKDMLEKNEKL